MAEPGPRHVLGAVILDEVSLAPASPEQEKERRVAVSDLLKANHFEPAGAPGGPYTLRIGLVEDRLALEISGAGFAARHLLSLAPFRRVVRDYMTICRSYNEAVRDFPLKSHVPADTTLPTTDAWKAASAVDVVARLATDRRIVMIRPERSMGRFVGRTPLSLFDAERARGVFPLAFEQGVRWAERLLAPENR